MVRRRVSMVVQLTSCCLYALFLQKYFVKTLDAPTCHIRNVLIQRTPFDLILRTYPLSVSSTYKKCICLRVVKAQR